MRRTPRDGSGRWITLAERVKFQERGQFPDDPVKIEGKHIRCVDVLPIGDIKEIECEGRLL